MAGEGTRHDQEVLELVEESVDVPREYRVLMHNDDFTTMDFVVTVLRNIFRKDQASAEAIMLDIHHKGVGIVGQYSYDVAASRVARVHSEAREAGFPLLCTIVPC